MPRMSTVTTYFARMFIKIRCSINYCTPNRIFCCDASFPLRRNERRIFFKMRRQWQQQKVVNTTGGKNVCKYVTRVRWPWPRIAMAHKSRDGLFFRWLTLLFVAIWKQRNQCLNCVFGLFKPTQFIQIPSTGIFWVWNHYLGPKLVFEKLEALALPTKYIHSWVRHKVFFIQCKRFFLYKFSLVFSIFWINIIYGIKKLYAA